ncbi:TonB-dependent receptor plug domain-containing protein [Anaerospora sp.]|uniref:TonB-dependent receptor plug domain-containing protein n=1 Tax=Anaerospora sp. TaxID=1960278 RepID=UPI002897455E|nr:TonB-dependent receptor plug domain-containing protein [Anaerospora sp.]
MKKKQLLASILLALAVSAGNVSASGAPSYDLEEIIVTANAERAPITADTINVKVASPGKAASIPELLRQSSGLDIQMRTKAGDSQDGTVKLRGFDARRFTVLVDGRPVNMSGVMGGSYVDWTTIPLDTVVKSSKGQRRLPLVTLWAALSILLRKLLARPQVRLVLGLAKTDIMSICSIMVPARISYLGSSTIIS